MYNNMIIFTSFILFLIHPLRAMETDQSLLDEVYIASVLDEVYIASVYVVQEMSTNAPVYKKQSCPYEGCKYSSTKTEMFDNHVKLHQLAYVPYKCAKCHYLSVHQGRYKRHLLSHGEKTYECDQCSKTLKYKDSLVRHKNNQHSGGIRK